MTMNALQFHNLVRQHNKSAEEWIDGLRTATMEHNYKEVDRQLKEQLIHRLNDSEILAEILRELTKSDENMIILSEHALTWAKRVEVQRSQAVVINSLHELKSFDAILKLDKGKQKETIPASFEQEENQK